MKSGNVEEFIKYYQQKKVTGTYDCQREGTEYRKRKRALELRYFLELLDKKGKEKVLELGCSSGFLTEHLGNVTAIDTSEGMLEIANKKNPKAKCIPGDMFEIPFNKNSFDKVVTMRVWNHLNKEDFEKALRETKRVLKNRGIFVFDMEDKSLARRIVGFFYKRIFRTTGFRIYQYSLPELKNILLRGGFTIQEVRFLKHRVGRQIILRTVLEKSM